MGRQFNNKSYLPNIPHFSLSLSSYLDFLEDLDLFILLDLSSILDHVYPIGIAKGSDHCWCPTDDDDEDEELRCCCCCCLLADWLLFRLSQVDAIIDDEEEDDRNGE